MFYKEIYPPRISEFAYVTDKAYYEGDILDMELDIMNVRKFYLCLCDLCKHLF